MKILLGISGSIASYRAADVVKRLVALGHQVRCALTAGGREFVTPKSLETFSGNPVMLPDMFGEGHLGTDHIESAALGGWLSNLWRERQFHWSCRAWPRG